MRSSLTTGLLAGVAVLAFPAAAMAQPVASETTASATDSGEIIVTARKRTEKALQESEQRFRQLVAMSSDWYWEQDEEFRFTHVTGDFTEKSGIATGRVLGRRRWDYVPALTDTELGRDHIASTVYTLVLAYAGSSLPLLLLFSVANRSLGDVLTSESVAIELVRSAVGGIALALSVPLTTAIAAVLAKPAEITSVVLTAPASSPHNPT